MISDTGCNATGLGTLAYYDNKIWLTATNMIYHVAREGTAVSEPPHDKTNSGMSAQSDQSFRYPHEKSVQRRF